jgi:N-acetylneuraminate lyase
MYEPLHGLNSAIFTPFTADGGLNIPAFEKLLDWQIGKGITGFFVCGSTGEGLYQTLEERKLMAEAAVKTVAGRATVMVHVGAMTTMQAVELARHAESVGANAVSSVAPIYYPISFEGTLNHYKAIGGSTGLPFFIYHVPYLTGGALTAQSAERLLEIPNLHGIKFTDAALYVLRWIFDLTGQRLSMISGPDELHLPALTFGAHGAIGTTYNLLPGAFLRLREAYFAGDNARASELQIRCNQVIYELIQGGGLGAFKAAMKLVGHDLGPVRPPLAVPDSEQERKVFARLEAVGFAELAAL